MTHVAIGSLIVGGIAGYILLQRVGTELFIDRILGTIVVVFLFFGLFRLAKVMD